MSGSLEGKVALVTGGAGGIGRAIVERFSEEGAHVGVFDLSQDKVGALKDQLGDRIVTHVGDVRDPSDNIEAVEKSVQAFGRLDIFVGNAAVFDCFLNLESLPAHTLDEAFREIFDINVKGYLLGAKAAVAELKKTSGNMIFSVSESGFYANRAGLMYTVSKHAVVGLIRQLAYELAPEVRVNGVSPGGTLTPIGAAPSLRSICPPVDTEARRKKIESRNPLQIAAPPEDHLGAYVLLASDQGRAMTGSIIHSDGGVGVRG